MTVFNASARQASLILAVHAGSNNGTTAILPIEELKEKVAVRLNAFRG